MRREHTVRDDIMKSESMQDLARRMRVDEMAEVGGNRNVVISHLNYELT